MAEQDPDVQAESSPAPEVDAQTAAAAVTGTGAETAEQDSAGVPWKNRMAEMERRHQKHLEDMQAMFSQQIQSLQQQYQPPAQPKQPQGLEQYTDDELATLSGQGHATATKELVRRYAVIEQGARSRANFAEQREAALRQMYPDVNNPQSPMGRAAGVLYHQYVQNGDPQDATTRALAISNAAAALMRQQSNQQTRQNVSESGRQDAIESHQSIGGTSVAQSGTSRPRAKALTPEQQALATRMRVKDPQAAIAEARKRREEGRVIFGPGLSSAAERTLP